MVTGNEKKFLIGLGGVLAFIATSVSTLWTAWTCLGDLKQVTVLVTLAAGVPALLFGWFWNRKAVATTIADANAYEKLTTKSYWTPQRTVRLTASGETILLLGDGSAGSGITVMVNVHNKCPLTLEPGTLTFTSWTLEDDAGKVLFSGNDFPSNEFASATFPPGEGTSKKIKLPGQNALPNTGPLVGVRFRCDMSLAYVVKPWGPNTASAGSNFQSLVKDLRAAVVEPATVTAPDSSLDAVVTVTGELPGGRPWTFQAPLRVVMNTLMTELLKPDFEFIHRGMFANHLAKKAGHAINYGHDGLVRIADEDFNNLRAQLMGRGFVHLTHQNTTQGPQVILHLTETGRQFQVQETLRASQPSAG